MYPSKSSRSTPAKSCSCKSSGAMAAEAPRKVRMVRSESGVTILIQRPVGSSGWVLMAEISPRKCRLQNSPSSSLPTIPIRRESIPHAARASSVLGAEPPGAYFTHCSLATREREKSAVTVSDPPLLPGTFCARNESSTQERISSSRVPTPSMRGIFQAFCSFSAAAFKVSARSVFSHGNATSVLPKCPLLADAR